ncbi:MAG: hypothetical protein J7515_20635 [Caulobacter sp.]|nr:hypothetical protein [Caulobacter sp.]
MALTTYTFVAFTADGRSPFLDVRMLEAGESPEAHARKVLDEHLSCARIEVWDGVVRLFEICRDPAGEDAPA